MRSYETARGLFSFMSFVGWLVIIGGAIVAIALVSIGGQSGMGYRRDPGPEILLLALPGLGIALLGVLTLALSQMGRAGVDTAEYTQQLLQLSRESLEVSRQSLRQAEDMKTGFESLKAAMPKEPSVSYADRRIGGESAPSAPAPATASVGYESRTAGDTLSASGGSPALPDASLNLGTLGAESGADKTKT